MAEDVPMGALDATPDQAAMMPETWVPPPVRRWVKQAAPQDAAILAGAGRGLGDIMAAPGRALASETPISTGEMIKPAADIAGLTTLGAGAVPAEANSLRAGLKALAIKDAIEAEAASPDVVRLYRGGGSNVGGPKWVTTNRKYAEGYTTPGMALPGDAGGGNYLQYVDIPKTDPRVQMPGGQTTHSFEAPVDIADQLKPYYSRPGLSVATDKIQAQTEPYVSPLVKDTMDKIGIKAYHGSPHDFDRFDTSKIGSGEGAQAYGHGLYFAEHEPVARQYRDQLQWKGADWDDPQVLAQNAIDRHGGDRARAADTLQSSMDSTTRFYRGKVPPGQAASNKITQQAIDLLRSNEPITGKPNTPGRMYEVNIKADPEHFLDWDKPLNEQHQTVQDALRGLPHQQGPESTPYDVLNGLVSGKFNNPANADRAARASIALREAGIPGIKYLDQGSRPPTQFELDRAKSLLSGAEMNGDPAWIAKQKDNVARLEALMAKPGTHNYVVFDDKLIDILRKYGWAGLAAMTGLQKSSDDRQ